MFITEFTESIPKVLYKYRHFDDINHLKILTHNEVFFSSTRNLNDPNDCQMDIRYDLGSKLEVINMLEEHVLDEFACIAGHKKARRKAKELYKTGRHKDRNLFKQLVNERIETKFGIFSLSASYTNYQIWSLYSNAHKGFCVGFDTRKLIDNCQSIYERTHNSIALGKVIYCNDFPIINPYKRDFEEKIRKALLTKTKGWEYESEYRMFFQNKVNVVLQLPDNAIKRVILGSKILPEKEEQLLDIISKRNTQIPVYKAYQPDDEYGLKFCRVRL